MDRPDDTPQPPLAGLVASLDRSRADLAAERVEDFDALLARLDEKLRRWEAAQAKVAVDPQR